MYLYNITQFPTKELSLKNVSDLPDDLHVLIQYLLTLAMSQPAVNHQSGAEILRRLLKDAEGNNYIPLQCMFVIGAFHPYYKYLTDQTLDENRCFVGYIHNSQESAQERQGN